MDHYTIQSRYKTGIVIPHRNINFNDVAKGMPSYNHQSVLFYISSKQRNGKRGVGNAGIK